MRETCKKECQKKRTLALSLLALVLALLAAQLHTKRGEDLLLGVWILHFDQSCIKIDARGQCRDRQQGATPNQHQRRNRLVEKLRIHIGRLLQDQAVAARPFGALYLRAVNAYDTRRALVSSWIYTWVRFEFKLFSGPLKPFQSLFTATRPSRIPNKYQLDP